MKKFIFLTASIAALLSLASCTEKNLDVFGEDHYVHFTKDQDYTYRFSFATTPGVDEYTLEIPVSMIGRTIEQDLAYAVEVVTTGDLATTASAANYSFETAPVFHKGQFEDVFKVTLKNSSELSTERRLTIKVANNDNFKVGPAENRTAVIYFSNVLSRPSWWDDDMAGTFLGDYSDIKYQAFIVATGVTDVSEMTTEEIIATVTTFVYYLRELEAAGTPLFEADGITKVLATVPYARFI